jgi:rubrerythrin
LSEEGRSMAGKGGDLGISEHTTADEAIRLAMEREKSAQEFYARCAAIAADPGVKKMFEFLAREEAKHFDLLEKEYNRYITPEN